MIFADKLIQLRKKSGWSQEELAGQMDVTRQSVSKWESAQSIPDLEKIIRLSELFGVSLDYLLKDEIEEEETPNLSEDVPTLRQVSMEEASKFLSVKAETAKAVANAVFLCIISPICLLVLAAMSEDARFGLPENAAGGIGMIVLLALVAAAVSIFISNGSKTAPFSYLDTEAFETEYGVSGMVKERMAKYKNIHTKSNMIGTSLCILSLAPLFATVIFDNKNVLLLVIMLSAGFLMAGIGVNFFVRTGILWANFENFATNNWEYSWIVWVVAGVLYPAVLGIVNAFLGRVKK